MSNGIQGATRKRGFFSQQRVLMLFFFVVGLIIGIYFALVVIEPEINKDINERITLLSSKNNVQSEQIQVYVSCLENNNIVLESCEG
jgi:hypothetical protein